MSTSPFPSTESSPRTRAAAFAVSGLLLAAALVACSGGTPPSEDPTTSQLTNRVLVTNSFASRVNIVDGDTDRVSQFGIGGGSAPTIMAVSSDKRRTLIFASANNGVTVIDNATEGALGQVALPGLADSLVAGNDGTRGYAAVRNAGVVVVIDITNGSTTSIPVPTVRRLVLNPAGTRLLAFSDDSDSVTVIDTSNNAPIVVPGFDRPINAVFSSDNSIAYVMNCGPQCGSNSNTASVQELLMTTNPPTPGASVDVSAATVGLLNGGNLYVAGTVPGALCEPGTAASFCGKLRVLTTSPLAVTASDVDISDGFHHVMALGSNNKLFIGARACTNVNTPSEMRGCLSIFNTSGSTAIVSGPNGEISALQPIEGRNVVYVVEGDELMIYDTTTDAPQANQINFVGRVVDAKSID
ncbi:MAG: YncE family protein [Longimicrobiales bacterium]